jgi:transportin-1
MKLDISIQGHNLLDHLVPQFITFTNYSHAKIRLYALEILQSLSAIRIPALSANLDGYIRALFTRASDESPDVRRAVCAALGSILSTRADKLVPEMKNVVDYIAYCTKDADESVALEACEFWLTFAEDPDLKTYLQPYLPRIAPLLLEGMIYSEMDIMYLDGEEEDEAVPDKDEDIKPKTYSSKVHQHDAADPSSSSGGNVGKSRDAGDRALDSDQEDDEDYDDDDDEATGEWNLRKCSAAALDVMAVSFGNEVLEILLPLLKDKLFHEDWKVRESGILALGAIAEGE